MKLLLTSLLLTTVFFFNQAYALTCTEGPSTSLSWDTWDKQGWDGSLNTSREHGIQVEFKNLGAEEVTIVGNNGAATMYLISQTPDAYFYMEMSLSGNIIMWVYYPAVTSKITSTPGYPVVYSLKSYALLPNPVSFTVIYLCKDYLQ